MRARNNILLAFLFLTLLCGCNDASFASQNKIVQVAQGEIGKGEIGGDNRGPKVKAYTRGREVAWCAGFVSWVLTKARAPREEYILSARKYWTKYKSHRVTNPKPGDIICFYRGSRGSHAGHVGIVEKVHGNNITTIQGNVGRYPSKVKRITYQMGHIPHLLGFVRI